jgi:hypothetical protein
MTGSGVRIPLAAPDSNGHRLYLDPVQSAFVSSAKNHADTMIKVAQQYGFTPHSRGRTWMVAAEPDAGLLELDVLDLKTL